MKVSTAWLADYVNIDGNTGGELAEKLTRSGIEVDVVENRNKGVQGVVVGYVKSREKHPDADKLSVCVVDAGQGEDLQIVCGAPNVAAGQKVPVALVGAKLPDGLAIKRAKLRGVESQGMICSAKELAVNDRLLPKEQQEGILVLPGDTPVGASILDVLALADEVLELDLTPNRSDCLSMLGAAYEIGAILGRAVKLPGAGDAAAAGSSEAGGFRVAIEAAEHCSQYAACVIEGVKVGASPQWLQNRLIAAGVRPISNIVDVTNYVMLEYGQPLHAFDAAALEGGIVRVRLAAPGERIETLDGADRALEPHMLVIADAAKPVALAGVMGGANSEVTAGTTRILLESAQFAGSTVRRTSRQLGLRSESSLRFEKEVDPQRVLPALRRAAALIAELAGGRIVGTAHAQAAEAAPVAIAISLDRVNGYLGTQLSIDEVKAIFERLHFEYEAGAESLTVRVPSRRGDITRDVDLIEEVARLYGYDNIPTSLMSGETTAGALTKRQRVRRALRGLLSQSGVHEAITYAFGHPSRQGQFAGLYPDAAPVALAMPMSEDRSVLRTSLVPHLIDAAVYNRNRNIDDIALFEIGSVFVTEEKSLTKQPEERLLLSMLLTGKRRGEHWSGKSEPVDFYDIKGYLEKATSFFGIAGVTYKAAEPAGYHPGRTAAVSLETAEGSVPLGYIGQLHPQLQADHDLAETYVLEIELDTLVNYVDFGVQYRALPRYPAVSRDIAVVVDRAVPVGSLRAKAAEAAGELLESIGVFDVYTGERLGADKKSVALSLVYRHAERTLTDEDVTQAHGLVVSALESAFAAELRK
ncbi:phenylalanine--tRNA ligase subunit beta [Paenibacillus cymbidii]|uniref:phenylalanine--tRNA ligase subunit beta n=1 Tax=Paenibacillus cymbidii TaxID=1639034 RepID=UPI00108154EC|nr:phenylalanine--tRNA ligase subunit beta [Paenibacillus cymbidii]